MSAVIVMHNKTEFLRGHLLCIGGRRHEGKWYDMFSVITTEGNEMSIMMERDTRDELLVTWEAYNAK